ncbi:carbonyl reductase [NADPH] 3 [Patella vulgata]|uniref:carbonyl reductase [NADPH] 3 n=1 Tax=Patella vulgata TaxID=6465 RepID=UPI0024A7ED57|nr:carbonyl reductase [NADPH] 3 [Patella vulgata]
MMVTGGNKGVGFGIVRALCKQFKGDVILTARNVDLGKKAVSDLNAEGLKPEFYQLDICDMSSIETLKQYLQSNYGGLDLLVNNAAIGYGIDSPVPFSERAEVTIRTNFTATLDVTNALFPLLRPHSRIVHVSSRKSKWSVNICSDTIQARLLDPSLTIEQLKEIIQTFVEYREFNSKDDIVVNACCPGYVDTDLTSHKGTKTIDQGAETPVYCALLPEGTDIRGKFVSDKTVQVWP